MRAEKGFSWLKYLKISALLIGLFIIVLATTVFISYKLPESGGKNGKSFSGDNGPSVIKKKKQKKYNYAPTVLEENEVVVENDIVHFRTNDNTIKVPAKLSVNGTTYFYTPEIEQADADTNSHKKVGYLKKDTNGVFSLYNEQSGDLTIFITENKNFLFIDNNVLLKYAKNS